MTKQSRNNPEGSEEERVVVRDRRRVDPATGQVRPTEGAAQRRTKESSEDEAGGAQAADGATGAAAFGLAELGALRTEVEERTRDLQRVTAEYANYRKRVERDRSLAAEQATGSVLSELLPILDDLDRARDHGDLSGPFEAVADQLARGLAKFGLVAFGEKGDAFDPTRHEAVAHLPSDELTEPTCIDVLRRGYLLGERLLRPAMVAVAGEHGPGSPPADADDARSQS